MAAATTSEFAHDDAGRATRLAAALAISLVCHALVLVAAHGWRVGSYAERPLMVTLLAAGGTAAGGTAASASAASPADASAASPAEARSAGIAPPIPAPAPAAPTIPKPLPGARRRPTLAAARVTPRVPADANVTAPDAATAAAALASATTAGATDHALDARGAGAGSGAGTVGRGPADDAGGRGGGLGVTDGNGSGADGLRVFCASCPAPTYPGRARRQGWQGTVDVELVIGPGGAVEEARVGRSSGYPTLDDVALDVARESRFAVPTGNESLRGELRYRFVLDGATAER